MGVICLLGSVYYKVLLGRNKFENASRDL